MKRLALLSVFTFCFPLLVFGQADNSTDKKTVIKRYFELYNNHETAALLDIVADNFKMYSVSEDTATISIAGKDQLRKWLAGYFKEVPGARSTIGRLNIAGRYVSFIETATWGNSKSQSSLVVYEISDNKIRRVWYY